METSGVLNRKDLVQEIMSTHDITKDLASEVVDVLIEEISVALVCGDRVELRGFGSFIVKRRNGRTITNLKTHKVLNTCNSGTLYFRASKDLLKKLNGIVEHDDSSQPAKIL